jgi:hypothetical protein
VTGIIELIVNRGAVYVEAVIMGGEREVEAS